MRTYELMFVVDPRVSDEDVVTMTQDYKNMITAGGIPGHRAKRTGAGASSPIPSTSSTKASTSCSTSPAKPARAALPEVEHRMRQNDKILRYLTVRTDEDLKRAARRPSRRRRKRIATGSGRRALAIAVIVATALPWGSRRPLRSVTAEIVATAVTGTRGERLNHGTRKKGLLPPAQGL